MGNYLSDDVINHINNAMPINQLVGLGTLLDQALSGNVPVGSISTAEMADNAITTEKMADNAITTEKMADNAITTEKMADNAITTAKEVATPFNVTGILTAAAAAMPVVLLADSLVPAGKKVYITGILVVVSDSTAWTDSSGTGVVIEDTAGADAVTIAKAGLTANAVLDITTANITLTDAVKKQTGLGTAKGIQVKADSDFDAGSDLLVNVFGVIK